MAARAIGAMQGEQLTAAPAGRNLALDGLRGLAVVAVVVFHLFPNALPGGFLGVSVFFALSGYLITGLLVRERVTSGRIELRRFWARRLRRLMPAALITLGAITVAWSLSRGMTRALSGDVVAALAYVSNWRFMLTGRAYGSMVDSSPVLHFWSLAIEEQFYLFFPLLVAVALRRARRARRTLAVVLGLALVGSCTFIALHAGDTSTVYYSTFSRTAEILVGALAALVNPARLRSTAIARRVVPFAGAAALAALFLACWRTSLGTSAYYSGALVAIAALSVVVVSATTFPSWFSKALSCPPLAWLGTISYGLYLYHWPILIGLGNLGVSGWRLWVATASSSLSLSILSLYLLEMPIRRRTFSLPRLTAGGLVGAGSIAFVALLSVSASAVQATGFDAQGAEQVVQDAGNSPRPTTPGMLRVATFGDSTAMALSAGMVWSDPRFDVVKGSARSGCTVGRGGYRRGGQNTGDDPKSPPYKMDAECDWTDAWPAAVRDDGGVDLALIYLGSWDVGGRKVAALGDSWHTIGDPEYDDWLLREMTAATDALHQAGARKVAWLTYSGTWYWHIPRQASEYNGLMNIVASGRPDFASVIDIAGWLESSGQEKKLHPDGIHFTWKPGGGTGLQVVKMWLGDQIVQAARP